MSGSLRYGAGAPVLAVAAVLAVTAALVWLLVAVAGAEPAPQGSGSAPAASASQPSPAGSQQAAGGPMQHPPLDKALWVSPPAAPDVGARAFERFHCSRCHAVGKGPDRMGPNLGRSRLRLSFLEGAAMLFNHIPGMHRRIRAQRLTWPEVDGDDMVNIVAFITTYQYYLARVGQPGRPTRGEVLYQQKQCNACHSLKPGVKTKGPNLSRYGGGRSVLELAQAMWNHGPGMQRMLEQRMLPRPFFRRREMADLLAFLATRGAPARSTAYIEPGDPARGAAVFTSHQCSHCHSIRGHGGTTKADPGEKPPPDLGRIGSVTMQDYTDIAAVMWNHAVPMWSRMKRQGIKVQPLRNTEMADLVAFLFFLNFVDARGDAELGREVFRKSGCGSCHTTGKQEQSGSRTPLTNIEEQTTGALMAAMWRAAPAKLKEMRRRGIEWPRLKPADVRHLMAFLTRVARGERSAQQPADSAPRGTESK